jgi:hypothetical protein
MWQRTASAVLGLHVGQPVDLAICLLHGSVESRAADQLMGAGVSNASVVAMAGRRTFATAQACGSSCQCMSIYDADDGHGDEGDNDDDDEKHTSNSANHGAMVVVHINTGRRTTTTVGRDWSMVASQVRWNGMGTGDGGEPRTSLSEGGKAEQGPDV